MSALVKLSTKLPGDFETNGIDQQRDHLVENPKELMLAVVWLDVEKITVDTDTGEHVPTVRVRRIEPLGAVGEVSDAVAAMVQAAHSERTGRTPLPLEIAEVTEERYSDPLDGMDD